MSRARVTREVALQALGAGTPVRDLFDKGLRSFGGVRANVGGAVWPPRKRTKKQSQPRGTFVYTRLRFGAKVRFYLDPHDPLGEIILRTGSVSVCSDSDQVLGVELARRAGSHVETVVRIALAIERARQACIRRLEEQSRWL